MTVEPRPTDLTGEIVARIEFYNTDLHPYIKRLEPGGEAYTDHHVIPERLLAAHEKAEAEFAAAESAVAKWIEENETAVEATW